MMTRSTVRSGGSIALGTVCVLGTLIVLFWYVRSPADFTVNHLYILLSLVVAYGSGHFMWDAFAEGPKGIIRGLALTILFVVGTAICVGLSGGRSAEVLEHNQELASLDNGKRLAHEAKIAEANVDRREAKRVLDEAEANAKAKAELAAAECRTGAGTKCDGATRTASAAKEAVEVRHKAQEQVDARYWQLVAQLGAMKPEVSANANLKALAKAYALYSGDEKRALEVIMVALPYTLALLCEFGSIVFFKHGFGRKRFKLQRAETETVPSKTLIQVAWHHVGADIEQMNRLKAIARKQHYNIARSIEASRRHVATVQRRCERLRSSSLLES